MEQQEQRAETAGRVVRRRRRGRAVPLQQQQINAQRAYEAAQAIAPGRYSLEDYLRAYEATSRRKRARHKDRAWLLAQLQALEAEERGAAAPPARRAAASALDSRHPQSH